MANRFPNGAQMSPALSSPDAYFNAVEAIDSPSVRRFFVLSASRSA
jgi:hypothetical protein